MLQFDFIRQQKTTRFQMPFLGQFHILLRIFQFIGVAPMFVTVVDKVKSYAYLIPIIASALSSIVITTYLLLSPYMGSYGPINTIINFTSLISVLLTNLAAYGQCYHRISTYNSIALRIQQMTNSYKDKFLNKLPFLF